MDDLRDLYQEVILDHGKRPRNFGRPDGAAKEAEGHNPVCGDRIRVYVDDPGGRVDAAGFDGQGCAISMASASLMTECVRGKTREEIDAMFEEFQSLVTGRSESLADLGKLAVFAGVREFPMRVKCATLAWHTLRAALGGAEEPVTTEAE